MSEITKNEAIILLALRMIGIDDNYSIDEDHLLPKLLSQMGLVDIHKFDRTFDEIFQKIKSDQINVRLSVDTLSKLSQKDRMDAMVTCILIAYADGQVVVEEEHLFHEVCTELEIDPQKVMLASEKYLKKSNFLH